MEGKIRPCLVLSVAAGDSDRALFTVVPHTTSLRGSRFECVRHVSFLKVAHLTHKELRLYQSRGSCTVSAR
ncbi:MAG TPA: hypothetical protein VGQ65_10065 [Thermoanaerobaculia bacterium]|nr:hypothetical protein [Thermoanaerobaculia bacterium]